jgi:FtsZ-binding cell division protein ZapB
MIETIFFDSYKLFFDEKLTVNAEYADESNSVLLVVGKVGYDSVEQAVKRGHRAVFSFDQDFEVRLLKRESSTIEVDVRRIENFKVKYTEFIDLTIGSIPESDEKFSQQEIEELKEKLTTLQKKFAEHKEFSREEADYARASFELIIKKLDESSKSAWKHTASGIGASLMMSISPEYYQQAIDTVNFAWQALAGK